ncbi:MAG TPA: hypothetical protein VN363_04795 [Anaerolineales bacterium]|nr:hypothetical protein [Anaerolineales bacterium]
MRKLQFGALVVLILLACRALQPGVLFGEFPATATMTPAQAVTAAPVLKATPTRDAAGPPLSPEIVEEEFQVVTHPDGALYAGDRVSFEIIPGADFELRGQQARVRLVSPFVQEIGEVEFGRHGIGQRAQATLTWAWDTRDLQPGSYELEFTILPQGKVWRQTLDLLPAGERPQPEAVWKEAQLDCCVVDYISGTEAERDLDRLLEIIEEQSRLVSEQMGVSLEQPVKVTLVPRVLGHGGFAGEEITISYLDRLYTASNLEMIFHHELVHIFDSQLGGDLRPTMLVEGLAVYLSGGHFKPEPILERAAVLLPAEPGCIVCGMGEYVPLAKLVDDFYSSQHEAGYLQAAALVEFLVESYGWEGFNAFYRDIHPDPEGSQAESMEASLQAHFRLSLAELDEQFQSRLRQVRLDPKWVEDVKLSVEFYDAVRRYQERFDPSAYFRTAWLPDTAQMQAEGITADFIRRPQQAVNIILENLLTAVGEALKAGQYHQGLEHLETVQYLLDHLPGEINTAQAN